MIRDAQRLAEVLTEISQWTLPERRQYLADIELAFGAEAGKQLRDGLTAMWQEKKQ